MLLVEKTDQTEAAGEIGLVGIVHMAGPGVPRRPEIDLLAVLERNPGEQAEVIGARSQGRPEPILLPRSTLSERPHVGIRGIGPSPPAQPVIGCVQHNIRSKFC